MSVNDNTSKVSQLSGSIMNFKNDSGQSKDINIIGQMGQFKNPLVKKVLRENSFGLKNLSEVKCPESECNHKSNIVS